MNNIIDIEFNGVDNSNPDNVNKNGGVGMAFGMSSCGTITTPTIPTKTHLFHIDGCKIILIHSGSSFKNVFVYNEEQNKTKAYRYDELTKNDSSPEELCSLDGKPNSTTTIGNIVVLNFDNYMRYLFRTTDKYVIRHNKLPSFTMDIVAACRLCSILSEDDSKSFVVNASSYPDGLYPHTLANYFTGFSTDDLIEDGKSQDRKNENEMEKSIIAHFVKLMAGWEEYGYLFSPVIVRAAYRLKSGEIASLTNPVLCYPFDSPNMAAAQINRGGGIGFIFRAIGYKLFASFDGVANYENYKDIIQSIDIFMSAPIQVHSEDGTKIRYYESDSKDFNGFENFFGYETGNDSTQVLKVITLGKKDALSFDELEKVSTFYRVRSIPFDEDVSHRSEKWIYNDDYKKEIYLNQGLEYSLLGYRKLISSFDGKDMNVTADSIVTLPAMDDQLRSNMEFYCSKVTSYNSRLIAVGTKYDIGSISNYYSSSFNRLLSFRAGIIKRVPDIPNGFGTLLYDAVAVGKDSYTGNKFFASLPYSSTRNIIPKYLTFEEPNVEQLIGMAMKDGKRVLATLHFKKHDFLNLSIFTGNVTYTEDNEEGTFVADEISKLAEKAADPNNNIVGRDDYIKESNVFDPYTFEESNTAFFNSNIRDVVVVPDTISLGQFGSNQLFVICDDGIYTVDVDSEGKLMSVHTYNKDIIKYPERACVLSSKLFVNNCVSWDIYKGQEKEHLINLMNNFAFTFDNLKYLNELSEEWSEILMGNTVYEFMKNCHLMSDGRNNQIVAFSDNGKFIILWKKEYGLYALRCDATYDVKANHTVLADNSNNIYEFEEKNEYGKLGLIVSRAIHLNVENSLSSVKKIVLRGVFDKDKVRLILYGTRNYKNWILVDSSKTYYISNISGTGYKAFKVVVLANLNEGDYFTNLSFEYIDKQINRLIY